MQSYTRVYVIHPSSQTSNTIPITLDWQWQRQNPTSHEAECDQLLSQELQEPQTESTTTHRDRPQLTSLNHATTVFCPSSLPSTMPLSPDGRFKAKVAATSDIPVTHSVSQTDVMVPERLMGGRLLLDSHDSGQPLSLRVFGRAGSIPALDGFLFSFFHSWGFYLLIRPDHGGRSRLFAVQP
jgi:hypothetical protein